MPVLALVGLVLLAVGCATPVGVTQLGLQAGYRLQTESALSAGEPSEPSKTVLRRLGLLDRFEEQPETVLAELHRGLSPAGDEDRLFALAELSFLHAERTGDREYFLASAVYAWALLFPGEAAGAQLQRSDPRLRLAYDFYNQGVAQGLTGSRENTPGAMTDEMAEVRLQPGTRTLPFGTMELTLDESGLSWGGYRLERFIPTTTLEVRGLRNRYFHPGLGASLAASLAPGAASAKVVGSERLGPLIKVPVTALLRLEDARASLASGRVRGRLEVYAADHASTVTVDGQVQPLEYDPTAALAYQLDKSPLYAMEIAAFLRAGVFAQQIPRDRTQDGLFMLHPYSPGKIPVVLVHGTLSSPVRWAELVNELEGDPRIRQRFQIWMLSLRHRQPDCLLGWPAASGSDGHVAGTRSRGERPRAPAHGRDRAQSGGTSDEVNRHRQRDAILGPLQQQTVRCHRGQPRDPRSSETVRLLYASSFCREGSVRGDASPRGVTRHWPGGRDCCLACNLAGGAARPARPGRHDDR